MSAPRPLREFPDETLAAIDGILCDIDDTLTWHGRLVPDAYAALCRAVDAGVRVVPVTGRPLGWAEVLAALWPVDAVIAEGGAAAVLRGGERRYWDDDETRRIQRDRLERIAAEVLAELPGLRLARDADLRRVDVAFDVGETVKLPPDDVARVARALERRGVRTVTSSVHVHAVAGAYDKAAMAARLAGSHLGVPVEELRARWLFVGDSPNDQAGFSFFPHSVGVANVSRWLAALAPPPAFVADAPGGHGFAELVERLLAARPPRR